MPPRGKTPGLKRGRHGLPYWIARQVTRDTMDFPDKCIPLSPDANADELSQLCQGHTARLLTWLDEHRPPAGLPAPPKARPQYNGTVGSLCRLYQQHPDSPFHNVKHNTQKTYGDSLKVIDATVGQRIIRNVTTLDVRRWHREWKAPKVEEGAPRLKRAHDAVSMFRLVLRFGAALRYKECGQLDGELAMIRFERSAAREQEMNYAHATAFVRTALELATTGKIPQWRGRYMAIGVAAQFELALRQKDIIGEWVNEQWSGSLTWENVPGWRLRLKTSKTRAAAVFTLSNYPLLFPLLEAVPHEERTGAIVKGEHGLPIRERSYRKWFRQIAQAAEIPDEIWSMDSRAGAATEADEAGADLAAISDMLTHAEPRTTVRYLRRREKGIADAASARQRKRVSDEGGK